MKVELYGGPMDGQRLRETYPAGHPLYCEVPVGVLLTDGNGVRHAYSYDCAARRMVYGGPTTATPLQSESNSES